MSKSANFVMLRDNLRKSADIIDELLELEKKEDAGADVEKECEALMGRFVISMIELNVIVEKL